MSNSNENQVVNNVGTSDETSNVNAVINDQSNQNTYWCEEDGDFEVDEVVQQQGDRHETQPPQQPNQLDLVDGDGDFDLDQENVNSKQFSSNDNVDQTTTTTITNNNVMGDQNQNVLEDVETLQSSKTNNNQDITFQFGEDLDNMLTNEIGKINNGNLCVAQNNEVPVQSVVIDQKDVVTLEDEIIKSQSPEKVQRSKQSPQKGKQKKGSKKSKVDTEILISPTEDSTIKNKFDQGDQNDQLVDSENDPKTKSGRKVQRPEFFNPAEFGHGRRKFSSEPKDLTNESSSKKSKKQTGKRQPRKSTRKDTNISLGSENGLSEKLLEDKFILVQQDVSEDSQILYDPNNSSEIYVDPEEDNIVCVICHDGTSKKQNWIVFCDKCDAPYHQRCHKPRIEDIVVEDSQTEWICSKCKGSSRSNKRIKVDKKTPEIQDIRDDKEQDQELISVGAVLTREQKVEYLSSLPQDVLVNLLLLAEQMEPNIPLYPANILGRFATTNLSSPRDNEMDDSLSIQDAGECLTAEIQTPGLSTTEVSNLSTMDISPNLNPVNIEKGSYQNPMEQDTQQEPITPESSPPSSSLKEITEHSKDSYLHLYIRAMSEIGNPNGSTAQTMHSWIKSNYNVPENFTARAKKALHHAVSKGIFVKNSRMTYKFNPDYTFSYTKAANTINTNGPITEDSAKNNGNGYDGQKTTYKELSSGLQGGEEISGEEAYTTATTSQRSSLSNHGNNNLENNNGNVSKYNQASVSSDKQQPPPSQPITSIPKLSVNAQIVINNEQTRTDIRLPPLAPKPPINVLPSIMRNNSINYQPLQQQRVNNNQNELLASSIGGGGNEFYLCSDNHTLFENQNLLSSGVNTHNITNYYLRIIQILAPSVIRSSSQISQQPQQQIYDNTKIRTPSSSIPSLQSLPAIETSLNGNVNKIRTQQLISLPQSLPQSTIHNTATTIPASPQQTWPSSFNPFYMSPQHGDTQFTTIFDNTFYDPTSQQPQHHHQQHSSAASTNDYNNVVIGDLHHNDNSSIFHRMGGNQQDNSIIGEWEYRNV